MAGLYGGYLGNEGGMNNAILGAPGNAIAQRIYGPTERGQYNRPGPRGAGIVQPEVFMAPYPGVKPGEPTEYFPLGNPAAGYRFQAGSPTAPGNAAGLANAQFYNGPQYAQMPVGFAGKTIS
jgi:hypothetical protein